MENKRAFTLIELLVVIAIIAILAAILFPVFLRAKQTAQQSACLSNQGQIGKALMMYLEDNDDVIPVTATWGKWWLYYSPGLYDTTKPLAKDLIKKYKYIKNDGVWYCPVLPPNVLMSPSASKTLTVAMNETSYCWNYAFPYKGGYILLGGRSVSSVPKPTRQPMWWDAKMGNNQATVLAKEEDCPHNHGLVATYLDGHTKWNYIRCNFWVEGVAGGFE